MSAQLKDGDIYFWRWRDHEGRFMPYHCRSQKAIVRNGYLTDTFWGSTNSEHILNPDDVVLDFKGNEADLRAIDKFEADYYEADDVVDMRHANSSSEKVYVKTSAKRSQARILEHLKYKREKAEDQIRYAQNSIERIDQAIAEVAGGKLDGYFPC